MYFYSTTWSGIFESSAASAEQGIDDSVKQSGQVHSGQQLANDYDSQY